MGSPKSIKVLAQTLKEALRGDLRPSYRGPKWNGKKKLEETMRTYREGC